MNKDTFINELAHKITMTVVSAGVPSDDYEHQAATLIADYIDSKTQSTPTAGSEADVSQQQQIQSAWHKDEMAFYDAVMALHHAARVGGQMLNVLLKDSGNDLLAATEHLTPFLAERGLLEPEPEKPAFDEKTPMDRDDFDRLTKTLQESKHGSYPTCRNCGTRLVPSTVPGKRTLRWACPSCLVQTVPAS